MTVPNTNPFSTCATAANMSAGMGLAGLGKTASLTGGATAAPGTALEQLASSLAGSRAAAPSLSATFRLDCGRGPVLSLDGNDYETAVTGTLADVVRRLPVKVSLCTPGGQLSLGAGQHWLTVAPSSISTGTATSSGSGSASRTIIC